MCEFNPPENIIVMLTNHVFDLIISHHLTNSEKLNSTIIWIKGVGNAENHPPESREPPASNVFWWSTSHVLQGFERIRLPYMYWYSSFTFYYYIFLFQKLCKSNHHKYNEWKKWIKGVDDWSPSGDRTFLQWLTNYVLIF